MDGDCTDIVGDVVATGDDARGLIAGSRYDLASLALSNVVRCGYAIRQVAYGAQSMEDVANRIVDHPFTSCRNRESGENDIALVIMFTKADVPRATAEAFRTVALKIKTAILPFEEVAIFDGRSAALPAGSQPESDRVISVLRSKVAALEELEGVYDRMVIEQSGRLEQVVLDVAAANRDLQREIESREQAEAEREKLHEQLVVTSRLAGMAEIAADVLHNVGNVLNGVNVSATLVRELLRDSELPQLRAAVNLLNKHADDLGDFIARDERGKHFPSFLAGLANVLERESTTIGKEVASMTTRVDHLKTIVNAQQSYTTLSGVSELVSISDIIEDALKIATPSLDRHGIEVVREFADLPQVSVDKQKLMQILVNLIGNAKDAILESPSGRSRITLKVSQGDPDSVFIDVCDTGVGIPREHLAAIFAHGVTTKQQRGGTALVCTTVQTPPLSWTDI
jgi:signal transduction histidine kinase